MVSWKKLIEDTVQKATEIVKEPSAPVSVPLF